MNTGKELCKLLKLIRTQIAEQYGLEYKTTECHHKGNCKGTCPLCDAELEDLQLQLDAKGISNVNLDNKISQELERFTLEQIRRKDESKSTITNLEGMPFPQKKNHENMMTKEDIDAVSENHLCSIPLEGNISEPPVKRIKKRRLYKKCPIAGLSFHNIDDVWDELYVGAEIALVRDKNNKYDKNAIAIALANDYDDDRDGFDFDYILGYMPRTENEQMAMMMDMGWREMFETEICELNEHRPYSDRIHIAIYIISKDEEEFTRMNLRALSIDDETYDKIGVDFMTNGCTYFRWGGFPPWERNLPNKDKNVVFLHKQKDDTALYLLHLIAIGNDAYPFVEDKEELDMCDDCCHYVFTNVKGPLTLANCELTFLESDIIDTYQPESFLSKETSEMLMSIFNKIQ